MCLTYVMYSVKNAFFIRCFDNSIIFSHQIIFLKQKYKKKRQFIFYFYVKIIGITFTIMQVIVYIQEFPWKHFLSGGWWWVHFHTIVLDGFLIICNYILLHHFSYRILNISSSTCPPIQLIGDCLHPLTILLIIENGVPKFRNPDNSTHRYTRLKLTKAPNLIFLW